MDQAQNKQNIAQKYEHEKLIGSQKCLWYDRN